MNHDEIIRTLEDHKEITKLNEYDLNDIRVEVCNNEFYLTDKSKVRILNIISQEIDQDLESFNLK